LHEALPADQQLLLAFVWLSSQHMSTAEVEQRVLNLMQRLVEKLK